LVGQLHRVRTEINAGLAILLTKGLAILLTKGFAIHTQSVPKASPGGEGFAIQTHGFAIQTQNIANASTLLTTFQIFNWTDDIM
jgi:hypothetical protein